MRLDIDKVVGKKDGDLMKDIRRLNYSPKPEYVPKEAKVSPSYTELRQELERIQEDGDRISREFEVWMNSVDKIVGLLRHKEEEINKLRRIKAEITGEKGSE